MNNQLTTTTTKSGDYTSSQSIVKSQKILNSVVNFHMKTQQTDKNDQQSKSPDNKIELRQTWRKPRMPYNKLPDAFQIKPKKKKTNKEVLDNIDRIVKYNQYKQIQKYLEPISLEKRSEEKPKEMIENGNPLATYQKYLKIKNKFSEQIQEKDLSMQKYKAFSTKQSSSMLKVTDCITLEVIKRGHHTGTIKKMLHVPTLRLLCLREQLLTTKDARLAIKDWLIFWQAHLNPTPSRFLTLHATLYNVPQGAVSLLTDYCKFGTLLDLLDTVLTLPQSVIRQVFVQIFDHLGYFYQVSDVQFGGISPSQVLITDEGRIRLGLGVYYQLGTTSNSIYSLKASSKTNFNTTQKHFMKTVDRQTTVEVQKSLDVFKVGLMMLQCAIGGFQKFQHSSILHQGLKSVFSEQGQATVLKQNACCLIHSQVYLLQQYSGQDQRSRRDRIEISKDRFSLPFLNFLCQSLKLHHTKRATFRDLLSHSFLRNDTSKDTKTVLITLNDLLRINHDWNQQFIESRQQQRLDKFIGHVLHVLSGCRREIVMDLLVNHKEEILNLNKSIGLNYVNLGERLLDAMTQMVKMEKKDFTTSI